MESICFSVGKNYAAVAGHVQWIQKTKGTVLVACSDGLLEVEEIEYEGKGCPR